MYFGLIQDPAYYMNLMNKEFMEYRIKFVVVEIDDLLVYLVSLRMMKVCCGTREGFVYLTSRN
jgi:hypothetical protein